MDTLPVLDPWKALQTECGRDRVALLYNSDRWVPSVDAVAGRVGCMEGNDRPFIVQEFQAREEPIRVGGLAASDRAPLSHLVVIGAHFPHPAGAGTALQSDQVRRLRSALDLVVAASGTKEVVLVADTNEHISTPSSLISQYLGFPAGQVLSTSLEKTCCFDNGSAVISSRAAGPPCSSTVAREQWQVQSLAEFANAMFACWNGVPWYFKALEELT
eukprot:SRR837773.26685.p1 GENE.SRR837773.26685~~SRR837773.26685.p1  ORF type:complete len:227 (-),score=29.08 SRR837773.26685:4-651(-)